MCICLPLQGLRQIATNRDCGLSRTKAESESEWVRKSVVFRICKKLSESDNIPIRIQTLSRPYPKLRWLNRNQMLYVVEFTSQNVMI